MQHAHPKTEDFEPVGISAKTDVSVSAVSHTYRTGDGAVLSGIDLKIEPGEVVALIGRSGSGKSTLLHIIAGLLSPSEGAVHIGSQRVNRPSPAWVMMFQAPSLFPWMSVAQNVGLGLRYSGQKEGADQRVQDVLGIVELTDFAERNVQDMSGGQQQRVALARSLAPRPDVLLLDEPFSALDMFTRQALQQDVRAIAKRLGLTLLLVTHDVSEAVLMADRAILLQANPGRVAGDTPINVSEGDRETQSGSYTAEVARLTAKYSEIAEQKAKTTGVTNDQRLG